HACRDRPAHRAFQGDGACAAGLAHVEPMAAALPVGAELSPRSGAHRLGEAARQGYPELPYAQDKMRELGTQLGLECMASAVVGPEIVILAKSGATVPLSSTAGIGQRVPLVPPLATVFFAWSQDEAIEAAFAPWAGSASKLTESYRRGLRAVH